MEKGLAKYGTGEKIVEEEGDEEGAEIGGGGGGGGQPDAHALGKRSSSEHRGGDDAVEEVDAEAEAKEKEKAIAAIDIGFKSMSLMLSQESIEKKNKPEEVIVEDQGVIPPFVKPKVFHAAKWVVKLNRVRVPSIASVALGYPSEHGGDPSLPIPSPATLLCFHGMGQSCVHFQRWAYHCGQAGIPVYAVCLPGRLNRTTEAPMTCVFEAAFSVVEAMRELGITEPSCGQTHRLVLFGHSVGALIAFEVARVLSRMENVQIVKLVVSSSRSPKKMSGTV